MRCISFTRGNKFRCFYDCSLMADISRYDDRETNSEEIFNCGFCSFKASDFRRLRHHIDQKHSLTYLELKTFDSVKIMNRLENNRSKQSYLCSSGKETRASILHQLGVLVTTVSGLMYLSNDDIEANSEETFKCGFCSFRASNFPRMRHHIDRKHSLTLSESNTFDK